MKEFKILIAEDDDLNRQNLNELLESCGYEVHAVADGRQALETYVQDVYDLVVTDLRMPNMDGLELLKQVKELNAEQLVILVTGYGSVQTAVDAMKMGAFDYITKPLKDDLVRITVSRALSFARLKEENVDLKDRLQDKFDFGKMIGYSDSMKKVFEKIEKVAKTDSTVLIHGESGTGKELVARAIHFNSDRKYRPLVPVNCGAIPEELLESELFGHEKGAFTGAIRTRIGRFELAQGGTIFLDEIGDMSPSLQVKVLRVIQEKQFERIGGVKTMTVDVRIITATNQDLEALVAAKKFREDLYYRINVIPIYLPPLRERGIDMAILANHFLKKFNEQKKRNVKAIDAKAMAALTSYPWPGNVREMENLIEMLVVMKEDGVVTLEDLPNKIRKLNQGPAAVCPLDLPDEGVDFNKMLVEYERDLILRALDKCGGVKNKAAKLLNLKRTTLVEKLKRL
ncbi:MAG TPA: sigma-54 dependent transcriptional regulator [Syntrophales bacterium]|nr:sigma-54 dependent transcriptional regulator [Syntrophales bacterium]HOU77049.1 sigma-54 dependent transcriptional regulator [Syntrophales bacterium]HPC32938.1 sigma-54 dependent transcriptional regulator [Syntrophales bacterium]HQG35091.1 sigma-54 dependent transcriptional regulator [Syntrophales bacterium]HQJ30829.1 sigma-54 dependent transcriptional regulator [Syntrophales bacterium]